VLVDVQVAQEQPIIGMPTDVPVPRKVKVREIAIAFPERIAAQRTTALGNCIKRTQPEARAMEASLVRRTGE
jgi:hypothetical protein